MVGWTGGLALTGVAWLGCESPIPRIDPHLPAFSDLDEARLAELRQGRAEYVAKCSGCHALYAPARGTPEYWEHWTAEMVTEADLSQAESSRILAYLLAVCDPPPTQVRDR